MNTQIEYVRPDEIEKRSFEIIGRELEQRGIVLDAVQEPVTKRVIHTTADFDYADTLVYSENAVEKARNLIKNGAHIVTDTNMAKAGINKKRLAGYGGEVHCFMADEDVAAEAKSRGGYQSNGKHGAGSSPSQTGDICNRQRTYGAHKSA